MRRHRLNTPTLSAITFVLAAAGAFGAETANLLSLQEGALPIVVPPTYSGWNAENLLDDSPGSGWACQTGRTTDNVFVFELAETATLERFEFDNAAVDDEGASARDVLVEVSTVSADAGFASVLEARLANTTDGQGFPAARKVAARWVRLTLRGNYGSEGWTELFSFRGLGPRPERPAPLAVSGTYASSFSDFHLRQQGTALTGCYEYDEGVLSGSIEGRVMKLSWQEAGGPDDRGPAVMVFSRDAASFRGFYWKTGQETGAPAGAWNGTRTTTEVGSCPHWSGSVGGELKKRLSAEKRARLYGILFDTDSAVIRPESRPVLDEVLELLRGEPTWTLTIEGHTDATGADAHNQTLSQQRADSVRAYLVTGGVEAARLRTAGFGESRPVADNASELGRAQNRRVELVRD